MKAALIQQMNYYTVEPGLAGFNAGVTGRGINSIDYSLGRGEIRSAEKKILNGITGIETGNIVMLEQVHGNDIIHVTGEGLEDLPDIGEADGMVTTAKGIVLVIRTADCVPVIIYDRVKSVLGAVHSGWKGTRLDISGRCVSEMCTAYGSDPGDISAFILPSIGPEMYEVNDDVSRYFPEDTIVRGEKQYVNLWSSIERSLCRAGLKPENILQSGICNRTDHREFFSHRFGDAGRNLNFAYLV